MDKNNENMQAVNNQRPLLENDEYYKEITELCSGATEPKFYPEFGNAFGILKSGIEGMNRSMDVMLRKIEEQESAQ